MARCAASPTALSARPVVSFREDRRRACLCASWGVQQTDSHCTTGRLDDCSAGLAGDALHATRPSHHGQPTGRRDARRAQRASASSATTDLYVRSACSRLRLMPSGLLSAIHARERIRPTSQRRTWQLPVRQRTPAAASYQPPTHAHPPPINSPPRTQLTPHPRPRVKTRS